MLDDAPISSPAADAFGHAAIAERIARRLAAEHVASIAVIGPVGSGKTSIRGMVEHHISEATIDGKPLVGAERVCIVPFSAWPYESTHAVIAALLAAVVRTLVAELGWDSARAIPPAYLDAVEGVTGGWGKVIRATLPTRTPDELLAEVDAVAEAGGIRLVVWLEDLERFAAMSAIGSDAARERIAPLAALLHRLNERRSLSVVVATPTTTGVDLEKVVRYIEVLPTLSKPLVRQRIAESRQRMLSLLAERQLVDSAEHSARTELDPASEQADAVEEALQALGRPDEARWVGALAALCRTPRALKQGLRECHELWNEYLGEIDPDHLLAVSLLRHGRPDVFASLPGMVDRLRRERRQRLLDHRAANRTGDREDDEIDDATRTIRAFLFNDEANRHPQGFAHAEPTDYWRRYLARAGCEEGTSDQQVLKALRSLEAGSADEFVTLLLAGMQPKVLHFGQRLTPDAFVRLVDTYCTPAAPILPSDWTGPSNRPIGLTAVAVLASRLHRRGTLPGDSITKVLCKHIAACTPLNLQFAAVLVGDFADAHSADPLLSEPNRDLLIAEFGRALVELTRDLDAFVQALALEGRDDFALHRVVRVLGRGFVDWAPKFSEWSAVAAAILSATRTRPARLVPKLACVVSKEVHYGERVELEFSRDLAQTLFDAEKLLAVFGGTDEGDAGSEVVSALVESIRRIARPTALPTPHPDRVVESETERGVLTKDQ